MHQTNNVETNNKHNDHLIFYHNQNLEFLRQNHMALYMIQDIHKHLALREPTLRQKTRNQKYKAPSVHIFYIRLHLPLLSSMLDHMLVLALHTHHHSMNYLNSTKSWKSYCSRKNLNYYSNLKMMNYLNWRTS